MNDTLLSKVREMQPELTSIRQNIHAHLEMAMKEMRRSTLVATKLKEWGITLLKV